MTNSNLKILFCGILKSPFILQDLELLKKYYTINIINLDVTNDKREGIFYFLLSLLTKDIYTLYKSDVVYIWFANLPAFPLILLSKLFKKRSILMIGGWEVANYPEINYGNQMNKLKGAITRWCLQNATVVITFCYDYKSIIKDLVPRSIVYIVPMAVDKSLCECPLPIKSDIVVTALMSLQFTDVLKGIPTFKAVAKCIPYECNIYEAMPHDILMNRLRESKVYCQLSYTESFGITNLEAMACGCVPVVTDRGALPEIVGNTGVIVPYGDVDATINAIHKAMTMDGSAARERAKMFIEDTRIQLLSSIIEGTYINIPLVSVVIPSYNSARWLDDTIGSILNQTHPNIEIILVDDCSTDNTYEIISQYKNVKYIKNNINMGECFSSRRGFDEANGEYICRLSADDMYANPDKIKHQVDFMERAGVDWTYNSINCVGETLKTAKTFTYFWMVLPTRYAHRILQVFDNYILKFPYFSFIRLFFGNPVNSSTLMFRRSSYFKSVKWADERQRTDCDGLLLYNLFLDRFKCMAIQELGAFYRIHLDQATNTSKRYLNDVRNNKLEVINKVLVGKYPLWLKYAVKIIRKYKI